MPGVGLETLGAASGVRCDWPLGSGAADGGCGSDVLNPLGGDDDGVWWFTADPMLPSSFVLSVAGWRTGQPRPAVGTMSWASSQEPSPHPLDSPTSSPFLYAGGPLGTPSRLYLPRFTPAGLYLEQYTLVDPASVHGADTLHVWTMSGSMLTWWAR